MNNLDYVIVGGGLSGDAAVKGIRELDPNGSIAMFSTEPDPPYKRPELSKGLWLGKAEAKIWRKTADRAVDLHLSDRIAAIDAANKTVTDEHGESYTYNKLLLATGCFPIKLPFGGDRIVYYRDFQDYLKLRRQTEEGERFLVIGGGFIGSEIASSLRSIGKTVSLVFPEETIGARLYPAELAGFLNEYYREHGVDVLAGDAVASIKDLGETFKVTLRSGKTLDVDGIVAGIGVRPDTELAEKAGLKIDNGIVVDNQMVTSHPDIFAAGDVANFYHAQLKKRVRVEHEDHAVQSGKLAGRNMAGANLAYTHIPAFYSDLFELGYEAVGELNGELETIADWQEPFKKGVVYYLADNRVRGVLLWHIWDAVPAARSILEDADRLNKSDLNLALLTGRMEKDKK